MITGDLLEPSGLGMEGENVLLKDRSSVTS